MSPLGSFVSWLAGTMESLNSATSRFMASHSSAEGRFDVLSFLSSTFQESKSALKASLSKVIIGDDAMLSMQIGLAFGIVIVSLLIMFPGEPFDYTKLDGGKGEAEAKLKKQDGAPKSSSSSSAPSSPSKHSKKSTSKDAAPAAAPTSSSASDSNSTTTAPSSSPPSISSSLISEPALDLSWDVDRIMQKTKKLQKLFFLTDDQMSSAIKSAQLESAGQSADANLVSSSEEGDGLSLSAKVDIVVYTTLICAIIYFVRRDFGMGAVRFMIRYFPRESQILGISLDQFTYHVGDVAAS